MKQENIVEKALAVFNRQPKKLQRLIQAEQERAAVLDRIKDVWRRLVLKRYPRGIDVDAKRRAQGKPPVPPLEDHLTWSVFKRATPLADALLAEIDAMTESYEYEPEKLYDPDRESYESYEPEKREYMESKKPGITRGDVFRIFGNEARTILQGEVIDEVLGNLPDKPMPIELGACEHCSKDYVPEWRRGGSIVRRTWPDGRAEWCCHCCGRVAKEERKIDES
jgi:hypothetical protein